MWLCDHEGAARPVRHGPQKMHFLREALSWGAGPWHLWFMTAQLILSSCRKGQPPRVSSRDVLLGKESLAWGLIPSSVHLCSYLSPATTCPLLPGL